MDAEIIELSKSLRRERVERARRMPLEEKFRAGGELFDAACEMTKAGIRHDFPHYDESQVLNELRRRLSRREARENRVLSNMNWDES